MRGLLVNKNHIGFSVEKNAFTDDGDGLITFPNKLVITDNTVQRRGDRYDIASLDLSEFNPNITVDHDSRVEKIVGKVSGLKKVGNKVVIDSIKYAVKESALARLVYDLTRNNFSTEFSTETYGPLPDENGVFFDAKLYGLSQVVGRNNVSAVINNTIEQAKQDGLDTSELDEFLVQTKINHNHKEKVSMKTIKNTRDFAIKLRYKNSADEEVETTVQPDESIEVSDEQAEAVNQQIKDAEAPQADVAELVSNAVKEATKSLSEELAEVKNAFSKDAKEPEFKQDNRKGKDGKKAYKGMSWEDRAVNQIESFRKMEKFGDAEAANTLREINEVHLEMLKEDGKVSNHLTIGDLGNYVISPEQLSEIVGFRSNYSPLVDKFTFRDTLSTQTQWLKRSGDISMTAVDYDNSAITDSGYLKPVSSFSATLETMTLEELAAVTPVANAATRFLAADILGDVNAGYRTDYQRKLAQLIVARLEQAVDSNGLSETYTTSSDLNAVKDFANVIGSVAEKVPNGTFIMNHKSYWKFVSRATGAGISGPLANLVNTGDQPNIFGIPVIVVPNDLLPDIDSAATVTHAVGGSNVTINHGVFYVDPQNWVGRTSGGLQYDLSTDAAYEVSGTVYSAFQRNQIVLRGAFFRGGEVSDDTMVAGLLAPGVS